jgi:CHAD domain-containing protein
MDPAQPHQDVTGAPAGRLVSVPGDVLDGFGAALVGPRRQLLDSVGAAGRHEVEGTHRLRVAIRRLRALVVCFRPHLETEATDQLDGELRRLGRCFGVARDWDVFCEQTVPAAAAGQTDTTTERFCRLLLCAAEPLRQRAHDEVAEELRGPAFGRVATAVADATRQGGLPALLDPGLAGVPLERLAPELLDRMARKVKRRARGLDDHTPADRLHALRKSTKKLRYGVEFLGHLYPEDEVQACLKGCKKLQSLLGELNDVATIGRLMGPLADRELPGVDDLLVTLGQWGQVRQQRARQRLPGAWHRLRRSLGFWA